MSKTPALTGATSQSDPKSFCPIASRDEHERQLAEKLTVRTAENPQGHWTHSYTDHINGLFQACIVGSQDLGDWVRLTLPMQMSHFHAPPTSLLQPSPPLCRRAPLGEVLQKGMSSVCLLPLAWMKVGL